MCLCVCLCACVHACVCVCMCACVRVHVKRVQRTDATSSHKVCDFYHWLPLVSIRALLETSLPILVVIPHRPTPQPPPHRPTSQPHLTATSDVITTVLEAQEPDNMELFPGRKNNPRYNKEKIQNSISKIIELQSSTDLFCGLANQAHDKQSKTTRNKILINFVSNPFFSFSFLFFFLFLPLHSLPPPPFPSPPPDCPP